MTDLLALVGDLRTAGLSIGVDRIAAAAEALTVLPARPFWSLRVTLCSRHADLEIFDAVWDARHAPPTVRTEVVPILEASATGETESRSDPTSGDEERSGAGPGGELTRRDVRDLTRAELDEIRRLIAQLAPHARRRPVSRRVPARTGRVDARRTMRLMLRNGGEPSRIPRTRRAWRPRRLLLLIDVSKSMAAYSDVLLRFAHAAVAAGPAVTEVFAIGTRSTRLTAQLRGRNAEAAMRAVGATESDWAGGTTLGPVLRDFLRGWGGRRAVRSAVIVLGSDGMEFGTQDELPRQVARLARLGYALIWVNPSRALPGYVPLNPALVESLRHASHEVTGHNVDSLRLLAEVIAR